jgi:phage baseplate assembly protein gpV
MSDVVDLIQAIVRDQLASQKVAELGIVTQVYSHENGSDKNNYECNVRLRDSELELKRVAVAAQRIGAVAIPNVDDLVLVQFLNGDIHRAVITGRLYNDQDRPPEAKPHEFVYVSPDKAESGIRRIYMEFAQGNKLLLDDDKLQVETGKTKLTMKHDGDVELDSSSHSIKLSDGGSNLVEIKSQAGELKIQAQVKATVEAPQIELVQNAGHALVFGDDLLTYLNQLVVAIQSHLHAGETALGAFPVSPMTPTVTFPTPSPALLSLKVKTG